MYVMPVLQLDGNKNQGICIEKSFLTVSVNLYFAGIENDSINKYV